MNKEKLLYRGLFLLGFLFSGSAHSSAITVDLDPYSKATYLVNAGRYEHASERWHQLSISFLSSESKLGRKKMWQYAGLSEALAAIAADKENNAVAYQYWADSTRYLMTGGTNWEQMKKKLHLRYERANTQLATQLQVHDLAATVDEEWQQELSILQIWDEKLSIFSFHSPKLGLRENKDTNIRIYLEKQLPPVVYEPRTGKPKLSGLNTEFKQEMHLIPVESKEMHKPEDNADSLSEPVSERESKPVKASINRGAAPAEDALNEETESAISRHLIIETSTKSHKVLPKLSKSIQINGSHKNDIKTTTEPFNKESEQKIIITPLEQYQFEESELKANSNSEAPSLERVELTSGEDTITPVLRGKLAVAEEQEIEARQRRSFVPIPSPVEK